jgi:riboflavin synthase
MFTGLIEETGTVASASPRGGIVALTIHARTVMEGLSIDDSVNVNGVCQTVVKRTNDTFTVQAVKETLRKTTLGSLRAGHTVNLERAILPSARMGGHFVQGHVDGTGTVASIRRNPGDWQIRITLPEAFMKCIIPMGSICIDGVSLTVASVEKNEIMIAVIPHTLDVTTLKNLRPGNDVNVELDMIGKYVVGLIERMGTRVLR